MALIQKGDRCGSEFIRHRRNENRRRVSERKTRPRGMTESVSGHEKFDRAIDRGRLNGDPGSPVPGDPGSVPPLASLANSSIVHSMPKTQRV